MEIALTAVCGFLFGFLTATMILTRLYDKCESDKLKDYKIISRIVIKKLNGDSHEHVE